MSAQRRRTPRDARRRELGQNFLSDRSEVDRLMTAAGITPGELVVEVGAGRGVLTLPLVRAGAKVMAIERDPDWVALLRSVVRDSGLGKQIDVIEADFRSVSPPETPYRVVSNPPFGLTTALFSHLFDHPENGPRRADLLVQLEVARKRTENPPRTLRSAAWVPWWTFRLGPVVSRHSFRPVPKVDAAVLVAERRDDVVLPHWLAPELRELLRPGWHPPARESR